MMPSRNLRSRRTKVLKLRQHFPIWGRSFDSQEDLPHLRKGFSLWNLLPHFSLYFTIILHSLPTAINTRRTCPYLLCHEYQHYHDTLYEHFMNIAVNIFLQFLFMSIKTIYEPYFWVVIICISYLDELYGHGGWVDVRSEYAGENIERWRWMLLLVNSSAISFTVGHRCTMCGG